MTLIEKTLELLDLGTYEKFHIKGCVDQEGAYINYCIDYQGHLLYETQVHGKTVWLLSKVYNLVKILNGTCDIIYEENQENSVKELEIPTLVEEN